MTRETGLPETLRLSVIPQANQDSKAQPPAFLRKTYELVSKPATDAIISWGRQGCSFIVWDTAALAKDELPKYFKHNNFSSFVRQLNTYGFRKADPDLWEFEREHFRKDDFAALSRIFRRKGPAYRNDFHAPQSPYSSLEAPLHQSQQRYFAYHTNGREPLQHSPDHKQDFGREVRRRTSFDEARPSQSQGNAAGISQNMDHALSERSTERFGLMVETILQAEKIIEPGERQRSAGLDHGPSDDMRAAQPLDSEGEDLERQQSASCQCYCYDLRQLTEALLGKVAHQTALMGSLVGEVQLLRQQVQQQAEQMSGLCAKAGPSDNVVAALRKRSKSEQNSETIEIALESAKPEVAKQADDNSILGQQDLRQASLQPLYDQRQQVLELVDQKALEKQALIERYNNPMQRLRAYLAEGSGAAAQSQLHHLLQAQAFQQHSKN